MEIIKKKKFEKTEMPIVEKTPHGSYFKELDESEFKKLLDGMKSPVEAQKQLAVHIKHYLDSRMKKEIDEKGHLSDHTKRWCDLYSNVLDKIQKALYGDKSVNLNLDYKVTHGQIAAKMREVQENAD